MLTCRKKHWQGHEGPLAVQVVQHHVIIPYAGGWSVSFRIPIGRGCVFEQELVRLALSSQGLAIAIEEPWRRAKEEATDGKRIENNGSYRGQAVLDQSQSHLRRTLSASGVEAAAVLTQQD